MLGLTNGTEATRAWLDSSCQQAHPYMSTPATRDPATIAHNVRRPFRALLKEAQLRMISGTMKNSVPSATPHRKPSHSGGLHNLPRGVIFESRVPWSRVPTCGTSPATAPDPVSEFVLPGRHPMSGKYSSSRHEIRAARGR